MPEEALDIQSEWHGALTPGMKLWYAYKLPFTSYTTLISHSCTRNDFHAYVSDVGVKSQIC